MELTPTLNSLGLVSSELEEFAEAEEYYTRALEIILRELDTRHLYYNITYG